MRCPTCPEATLVMTERQGIEIDYCPQCRGVWLDRGELDKIIERSGATGGPGSAAAAPQQAAQQPTYRHGDSSGRLHSQGRRKSWLSSLFD
jgi:uncharacterized protein